MSNTTKRLDRQTLQHIISDAVTANELLYLLGLRKGRAVGAYHHAIVDSNGEEVFRGSVEEVTAWARRQVLRRHAAAIHTRIH